MQQGRLELVPVAIKEVDNISMGILPNGETFLSLQGLAKFCGVAPSNIIQLAQDWQKGEAQGRQRGQILGQLIQEWTESSEIPDSLYVEIENPYAMSNSTHAVPESIVMAITDYYAHYSQTPKQEAILNFRRAAKHGLRSYIYERLEYSKQDVLERSWGLFKERVLLNESPQGYFTMFDEATGIIASLIRHGIPVDDSIMPDGSLGIHWGKYWREQNCDNKHGARIKINHKFPDSYRQMDPVINAYPIAALSEFRQWFQDTYLPDKYKTYISGKVADKSDVSLLLEAVLPKALPQ